MQSGSVGQSHTLRRSDHRPCWLCVPSSWGSYCPETMTGRGDAAAKASLPWSLAQIFYMLLPAHCSFPSIAGRTEWCAWGDHQFLAKRVSPEGGPLSPPALVSCHVVITVMTAAFSQLSRRTPEICSHFRLLCFVLVSCLLGPPVTRSCLASRLVLHIQLLPRLCPHIEVHTLITAYSGFLTPCICQKNVRQSPFQHVISKSFSVMSSQI